MKTTQTVTIANHQIPVKNLDKFFWPDEGFTKADIMQYYAAVWPYIKDHLKDRPVSLVRYPHGISGDFFYQKDVPDPPPWLETILVESEERLINYAMMNNLESLIWAINLGCIEVHPWLSTIHNMDRPTYVIFDLDPMEPAVFSDAVRVALFIQWILSELSLQAFPKISGATGIHIYLPLEPIYTFAQTSNFVKRIGEIIIRTHPNLATNERKIANRAGKVYIDHLQNSCGKTIASVYSLRPFPGAPASLPVRWDELSDLHPTAFTIQTAQNRLAKIGDLFRPLLQMKQHLPADFTE